MDCVLVDTMRDFIPLFNEIADADLDLHDITTFEITEVVGPDLAPFVKQTFMFPMFFDCLKPLPGAVEAFKFLARHHDVPNDPPATGLPLAAGLIVGEMLVDEGDTQVFEYLPAQWKGQAPKTVITERTKRALASAELSRVVLPSAASLAHNVWDAVGLGLYHLKKGGRRE